MAHIKWSIHRDDRKIGTVEEVDQHLANRYVSTGMAIFADEPEEVSTEPVTTDSIVGATDPAAPTVVPGDPIVDVKIDEPKPAEPKAKAPAKSPAKAPVASE